MFIFKEITDQDTLLEAFRMRYQIYHNDPLLSHLVAASPEAVNLDGFDPYAHHYGVFEKNNNMVGYIRIIRSGRYDGVVPTLQNIIHTTKATQLDRPLDFYFNTHFPHIKETHLIAPLVGTSKYEICEPGRFLILPTYRSAGLAQFVIECAMTVICAAHAFPIGVIYCRQAHKPFYQRNGFSWLAVETLPAIPENPWHLLAITCEGVARRLPDLGKRIDQYRACHQIIYPYTLLKK